MCKRQTEIQRLTQLMFALPELDALQKQSLELRYLAVLNEFSRRCTRYSFLFHVGHFIITVGSLIVPALLSVQYADTKISFLPNETIQAQIYWTTWVLSLLVTMFNGIIVLYKVDKKYYFLHTTHERLRSEGWQYIQLTGRYAGVLIKYITPATHKNQFIHFCNSIEKIRMQQIEEEYYKYNENINQQNAAHAPNTQQTPAQAITNTTPSAAIQTSGKEIFPPSITEELYKQLASNGIKIPELRSILDGMVRWQSDGSQPSAQPSITKPSIDAFKTDLTNTSAINVVVNNDANTTTNQTQEKSEE